MISILMPLYNGIEFLQRSARSVVAQTHKEWELLIGLNGLSPRKIRKAHWEIIRLWDKRITICQSVEKGKVKTLNYLVKTAKYDRVCLLDVDDYWHHNKLEKQVPLMDNYDVVGTDTQYFGDKTGSPRLFLGKLSSLMFSYQNPIVNSAVMLNKQDANWDEAWEGLDDYNLWIHLLNRGKTFYNIPEVLVNHRIHNSSAYNHVNDEVSQQLRETLPKLSEEQHLEMRGIIERKEWRL